MEEEIIMNTLQAGFSRVNVTPMMGIPIRGYFQERLASGVLDELEINALALQCGDTKILLMTLDCCAIDTAEAKIFAQSISDATGVPTDAIVLHGTHSHTAPYMGFTSENPLVVEYTHFLQKRFMDAATLRWLT